MAQIPRTARFDESLSLLREGYRFIPSRCERLGSDVFETRLMLRRAICASGEDAARMFYQPDRFTRKGALPPTVLFLLQDRGSVQTKDGAEHRHRKAMFMSLMTPERILELVRLTTELWRGRLARWRSQPETVLHEEVEEILCAAVCAWVGVPLEPEEVPERTREFRAMIEGAGAVGPRNWRGLLLRSRTERWIRNVVDQVREGRLAAPEGSPLQVIAAHRELDGGPLPTRIAAVEIINLLRPTVAVARYVTFAALALHDYPHIRRRLSDRRDPAYLEQFVQEVRRFYPFFPLVGGLVKEPFEWRGQSFDPGTFVLLDLYGTNRDGRSWTEPNVFRPERFQNRPENAFNPIPQGGGEHFAGHRCAGEWLTIALVKEAVRLLTAEMTYDVPLQDLSIDLGRMPAIPASHFVIRDVRPI